MGFRKRAARGSACNGLLCCLYRDAVIRDFYTHCSGHSASVLFAIQRQLLHGTYVQVSLCAGLGSPANLGDQEIRFGRENISQLPRFPDAFHRVFVVL